MNQFCTYLADRTDRFLAPNWIFRLFVIAGLLLPLAFAVRVAVTYDNPVDFRYLWAAGRIWADGGNPYAPSFSETAGALYDIDGFHRWLYSPHVWGLTRGIAMLDFKVAFWTWTTLNLALIYIGTWLVASAIFTFERRWHWAGMIFLLLYTSSSIGASMSQTIGQFAAVTYFASAAFAYAVLRDRPAIMVLALIVITMKASLGLAFVSFALTIPRWRAPLLVAGVISLIMALPPILMSGVGPIVSGYLSGVTAYASYEPNAAPSMTGARNLLFYVTGNSYSGLLMSSIATILVALVAWIGNQRDATLSSALTCLAIIFFFVPLHLYDLMLVSVLAIGCLHCWFAGIYVLLLAGLFRVNRLSELLKIEEVTQSFPGSFLATIFLAVLMVASMAMFIYHLRRNPTS